MKARYFAILTLLVLGAAFWQIAQHRQFVQTQVAVITSKDQAGVDVSADESALKAYTHAHMGTSTSVFLSGSYNRALAASQTTAPAANGDVYAQAQAACASHADSIAQANCVQAYLASHGQSGANPQAPAPQPSKADYTQSFTSPIWTADSAGWLFLAALLTFTLTVYAWLLGIWRSGAAHF